MQSLNELEVEELEIDLKKAWLDFKKKFLHLKRQWIQSILIVDQPVLELETKNRHSESSVTDDTHS